MKQVKTLRVAAKAPKMARKTYEVITPAGRGA